jgi:glycosyltransferase involved in cell wall biosynthesis
VSSPPATARRMVILGGTVHHPGGIESFCARAVQALARHGHGWEAEWRPTDTAYFSLRYASKVRAAWRRLVNLDEVDLVWLQWSTLLDLMFLWRLKSLGVPVLVTPHLGAQARLQRWPMLRYLSTKLLDRADRMGLLFDGQDAEIALPSGVPRSLLNTFLPEEVLTAPIVEKTGKLHLIHAGRLSIEKGSFRMVELCAMLRNRRIPFTAQIIGRADADVGAALAATIAKEELDEVVTLDGWMDGDALIAALSRADVLIHLSELDSFPLIVLEGLAAGAVPVIANMAGASAMVRRYGGFITPGSSVAAAADWLAGSTLADLRRDGSAAAARVRHDQAWSSVVTRLEHVANVTVPSIAGIRG